ncbi:MAG TPA: 4-hydroxy-tetrahydrodipicolinate synthase [Dehalococcoidia bacterium]|jgi:4-hydroxy-tetrahydrodipicolinate synthase|nr:4-hydroxy-tetrahydrodipicolinate synthase [Chloroflexota bacterium]MDP5878176.1 4-hydroxy-tetrahydrodipicolinate synthase [Dehalococcoidia bacterium]MDP6273494.1 4-hydroxy-tetrahydrodipicolinate synthase [Dehalococcoidia bacterium]MDP7161402.1 4-hydroxy-tetrahydrodipicolinate synthase [Dehalococcoidia bacterium]MDP7213843.1 4-hydroxy-tetrahydrodipicolinate synthase [Dehalococcoidia bacterium]|tara:strand:+ start:2410 stop:3312 length:903 start_codon:yes stop_codon:yes gene_type:complete
MTDFGRLLTAMITPFDEDGDLNYKKARKLASALIDAGNDGLVIGGTTGEAPALNNDEKIRLFTEIKEEIGNRGSVVVGTSDNDFLNSRELTKEAEATGADGVLLTVPAYNKPPQEGLFQYFRALAESTALPCLLYNVPSRTALNMTAETTLRVAEIDNVVGVKEASSDPVQITMVIDGAPDGFRVWSGNDDETFSIMATGGHGIVSVAGHIVSRQIKTMMGLILEGDIEAAAAEHRRLLPLFKAIFWVTNPIPIKYAVNRAGFDAGTHRLPMVTMEEADPGAKKRLDEMLDSYDMDISED